MKHFSTPLFLCSVIVLVLSISFSISPVIAADCVIPDSGPWPPCATGGGSASPSNSSNNQSSNNECVIPDSGPWPPCATSGGASNSQPASNPPASSSSSDNGDCVIPSSGPWPPCATSGGGSTAPASTEPAPEVAPVAGSGQLVIDYIFYDGLEKRREGDEYAVIKNVGSTSVNLAGWRLNAGDPGQNFRFPSYVLEPGASCRVYTDEIHAEYCGFSFGRNSAVWNNGGDCGFLYDSTGQLVDEYCY